MYSDRNHPGSEKKFTALPPRATISLLTMPSTEEKSSFISPTKITTDMKWGR